MVGFVGDGDAVLGEDLARPEVAAVGFFFVEGELGEGGDGEVSGGGWVEISTPFSKAGARLSSQMEGHK